jgi:hypothetical protein
LFWGLKISPQESDHPTNRKWNAPQTGKMFCLMAAGLGLELPIARET